MDNKKAYGGDIIEIIDGTSAYYGQQFEVDMRQSDMGACDDDILMVTCGEVFYDDEYVIVKKINKNHKIDEFNDYMNLSNYELFQKFGSKNRSFTEFDKFISLVRTFTKQ